MRTLMAIRWTEESSYTQQLHDAEQQECAQEFKASQPGVLYIRLLSAVVCDQV